MQLAALFTTALALAGSALAQADRRSNGRAIVVVEASHGGAGNGLTNTTIAVPIEQVYTNPEALDEVSTLYLIDAEGVAVESVVCTPYRGTDGTGASGLPFTNTNPSYLSTNTVVVGSIVCETY
ncbi:hypothetical protein GGS23DRAFT_103669 [Durotheca rogersii]|uniref:uncharacterized protein n=1 Tax=Durotheca rogersii TaxID=419775 RepID=UPI00221F9176|nr:uncharacterized protein GGS23DRAFT_103669 [Durotheca rogersii]KAI5862079.1 hypothetical protein GGS23DRAFT_103669 [Durotheca rogersii]